MQSGPISSTVCRKWHVPPEEAQKQRRRSQPAINHTSVSLCARVCACVCLFGHGNVTHLNYRLISYELKKTFLLQITSLESLRNEIHPSLKKNINLCIHCSVFSSTHGCEIDCKHKTNSCTESHAAFDLIRFGRCQTVSGERSPSWHTAEHQTQQAGGDNAISVSTCSRQLELGLKEPNLYITKSFNANKNPVLSVVSECHSPPDDMEVLLIRGWRSPLFVNGAGSDPGRWGCI